MCQNKFVRNLFLTVIGLLLGFIVGEAFIRSFLYVPPDQFFYDKKLNGLRPRPNVTGRASYPGMYQYQFTHDSFGFRLCGPPNPKAKRHLLFLGDSFTYGTGVNNDQTFSAVIQNRLSKIDSEYCVENAGNPGRGTDYEVAFFRIYHQELKPDITWLFFRPQDFDNNTKEDYAKVNSAGGVDLTGPPKGFRWDRVPGYQGLIVHSQVARLLRNELQWLLRKRSSSKNEAMDMNMTYVNQENAKLTEALLRNLRKEVLSSGSQYWVFYLPSMQNVALYRQFGRFSREELRLQAIGQSENQRVISLTKFLGDSHIPISMLYYRESHWTALAHRLAGEYIFSILKTRLHFLQDSSRKIKE